MAVNYLKMNMRQKIHTAKNSPGKIPQKKDEAFKTVCSKSLKALFSVEADKPRSF
jgi:hypothetical protein